MCALPLVNRSCTHLGETGFMDADGLFALEGMHEAGAEQALLEMREALEYYCFNFLRPWMQEYFYDKVGLFGACPQLWNGSTVPSILPKELVLLLV